MPLRCSAAFLYQELNVLLYIQYSQEEVVADTAEEEVPPPEPESEEMKQLRDLIQVAMGSELKLVRI